MCELLRHFLLPLRRLIRRTRPLIARPVLPPRPLAGEGWGEGGIGHERSKVPCHSPLPSPPFWPRLILELRPAVLSGKCRSKLQHLTHGSCLTRAPLARREFCRAAGRSSRIRSPAAKRRVVDSGLNFLWLLSFLKKESDCTAGGNPGQRSLKPTQPHKQPHSPYTLPHQPYTKSCDQTSTTPSPRAYATPDPGCR